MVVLGPGGHATVRNDPYLTVPAITPAPVSIARARPARAVTASHRATAAGTRKARRRKPKKTVTSELARLYGAGQITPAQYNGYRATWNAALGTERRLRGTRKAQLQGVTQNLQEMAAGGFITPSRLPVLFLTLSRNRQYWSSSGPLLSYGQRVEFNGSRLVWEYYPGQGIELTVLGSFGVADGLYTAGRSHYAALQELLGELIPLAAKRGGNLTWEYYFKFDGGTPPWTSAMSQGTAIEALTRGYEALQQDKNLPSVDYLSVAHQALGIFNRQPQARRRGRDRAREALRPVLVRSCAQRRGDQRVSPGADRALRLRAGERRPHRAGSVRQRQCRGRDRGAPFRHRRLVAVSARTGGRSQLSRARHGVPAAAVLAHERDRLLHDRPAFPDGSEDAAGAVAR